MIVAGETFRGACFPLHGSAFKVLFHQQRGDQSLHQHHHNRHQHQNDNDDQVPQLVKMIGPDPSKFSGLSPRVDQQLGHHHHHAF